MRRITVIALVLLGLLLPASAFAKDPDERIVIIGPVLVDRGETTSDVVAADGDVTVRGTVDGSIIVGDGDVTIRGKVTGDVVTFAGTAILGRRAQVDGDLRYADNKPQVSPGAKVGGDVAKLDPGSIGSSVEIGLWVVVSVSMLVLGLLLLLLFPKAAEAVARNAKTRPLMAALVGLLAFILVPALGVIALISVILTPLGIGLLLAWLPLYGLAYTAAAFALGRLILGKGARILAFLAGLAILRGLALVPFGGKLIWAVATIYGLGALLTAALRARSA